MFFSCSLKGKLFVSIALRTNWATAVVWQIYTVQLFPCSVNQINQLIWILRLIVDRACQPEQNPWKLKVNSICKCIWICVKWVLLPSQPIATLENCVCLERLQHTQYLLIHNFNKHKKDLIWTADKIVPHFCVKHMNQMKQLIWIMILIVDRACPPEI